jgi:hypothetical protein
MSEHSSFAQSIYDSLENTDQHLDIVTDDGESQ